MLKAAPGLRPIGVLRGAAPPASGAEPRRAPNAGATHSKLARASWSRARSDFPPGASAGPHGAFRLLRHARSCRLRRWRPARSSSLSLPPAVLGLRIRPCRAWRRELRRARRGFAERPVDARRRAAAASQRQSLRRLPQSRRRRQRGHDAPLRSALRPLRHDADPQQYRRLP